MRRTWRGAVAAVAGAVALAGAHGLAVPYAAAGQASEAAGTQQGQARAQVRVTRVTDQMLLDAGKDGKNWLTYGGGYNNHRYSPLGRINKQNVGNLQVRYIVQSGVMGSFQATPIVVNGVMYFTTPYNHVLAVDARTGKKLWRHEHKLATQIYCCGPNNRGVAAYGDKVYMATLDGMLIALDAATGNVVWEKQLLDAESGYSMTLAPLAYKGKIFVGSSGAEYGVRGVVMALDANTGGEVWRFWLTPDTGWEGSWAATTPDGVNLNRNIQVERAAFDQYRDNWKIGGGSVWMTPSFDPQRNELYMGVGNPAPDLDGSVRPGDNLYTECLIALDADTGRLKYYYQYIPHDVWDLDATSPMTLFDARDASGRMVPAVGHAGKTGWYYVHDRATGKLIRKSQPFVPQENMFAQPTAQGTRMLPGANGGSEWSPTAFSPKTRNVYVLGLHQPMHYITKSSPLEKGKLWLGSAFVAIPGEEQWGTFSAINVDTGKITWQAKTEQPMIGGALATAGGVVFVGEANGMFKAYDDATGRVLWQFQAGAGVNAAPMTFEVDGEQFVAVAAGGNFQIQAPYGDDLLVFALPRSRK